MTLSALLALAIAGCGGLGEEAAAPRNEATVALSDAEVEIAAGQGGGPPLTAIDAARGDSAGMPADRFGPSRYDVELSRARSGDRPVRPSARETPATTPGSGADGDAAGLLSGDQAVTTGG